MNPEKGVRGSCNGWPTHWTGEAWVYTDTYTPIPEWGGVRRPCKKCGAIIGEVDVCLGMLPGVKYACCGHGDPTQAYIMFNNGVVVRGFTTVTKMDIQSAGEVMCESLQ